MPRKILVAPSPDCNDIESYIYCYHFENMTAMINYILKAVFL